MKVDRSFVAQMLEGVETREQLRRLTDLGCRTAQGYLFARPVEAAEIEPLLERESHFTLRRAA